MPESSNQNFNHLKIHTQYSICEGAIKIDDLQDFSKSNKIKTLALCDTTNLCGALEFAEKISKVGTQPVIGTQINFKFGDTMGLLPLFSLNEEGYKRIIKLSSLSFLENDELSEPHIDFNDLLEDNEGVAIFSGTVFGLFGELFNKGKFSEIHDLYKKLKRLKPKPTSQMESGRSLMRDQRQVPALPIISQAGLISLLEVTAQRSILSISLIS